jgi:hypothetical protein
MTMKKMTFFALWGVVATSVVMANEVPQGNVIEAESAVPTVEEANRVQGATPLTRYVTINLTGIAHSTGSCNIGVRKDDCRIGYDLGFNFTKAKDISFILGRAAYLFNFPKSNGGSYYAEAGLQFGPAWFAGYNVHSALVAGGVFSGGYKFSIASLKDQLVQLDVSWPYCFFMPNLNPSNLAGIFYYKTPSFSINYGICF